MTIFSILLGRWVTLLGHMFHVNIYLSSYSRPFVLADRWFHRDHHRGKAMYAQDAYSWVLYWGCLIHFFHRAAQLSLKTCALYPFSWVRYVSFLTQEDYHNFYIAFWLPFLLFGKQSFTKLRAGKHSANHNNLNPTEDEMGLRAFLHPLSCVMCVQELNFFCFW
jgi:hypothetical protein